MVRKERSRRTNIEAVPSRNHHTIGVIGVLFATVLARVFGVFYVYDCNLYIAHAGSILGREVPSSTLRVNHNIDVRFLFPNFVSTGP